MARKIDEYLVRATDFVLAKVQERGHDQAQVFGYKDQGLSLSYRDGKVDHLAYQGQNEVTLKLYGDQKKVVVSTTDLTESSLNYCVEKASSVLRFVDLDPCHGLPDPSQCEQDQPMFDLAQDHPKDISIEETMSVCADMEKIGHEVKGVSQTESVQFYQNEAQIIHRNSDGFVHQECSTYYSWHACFIAGEAKNMVRDYEYTSSRSYASLLDPSTVARQAAKKTVSHLGARTVKEQQCSVILSASLARSFIGQIVSALSGQAIYKGYSFLANQLDKNIFSSQISIVERPHLTMQMGSCWFDQDGIATKERVLIDSGCLSRYVLDTYAARKLGLTSTANAGGVHNLQVECEHTHSINELIKSCGTGVYITEWMGQGVDLSTGDFSKGVVGFWIENGEIQYPIHEVTIASTLQEMMLGCVAMSSEIDYRGNIHCGDLLIEKMTVSG